jgi:hypothetical protein
VAPPTAASRFAERRGLTGGQPGAAGTSARRASTLGRADPDSNIAKDELRVMKAEVEGFAVFVDPAVERVGHNI